MGDCGAATPGVRCLQPRFPEDVRGWSCDGWCLAPHARDVGAQPPRQSSPAARRVAIRAAAAQRNSSRCSRSISPTATARTNCSPSPAGSSARPTAAATRAADFPVPSLGCGLIFTFVNGQYKVLLPLLWPRWSESCDGFARRRNGGYFGTSYYGGSSRQRHRVPVSVDTRLKTLYAFSGDADGGQPKTMVSGGERRLLRHHADGGPRLRIWDDISPRRQRRSPRLRPLERATRASAWCRAGSYAPPMGTSTVPSSKADATHTGSVFASDPLRWICDAPHLHADRRELSSCRRHSSE